MRMLPTAQHLIRLALGAAQSQAAVLDSADQALMVSAVQMNLIERLNAAQRGRVLERALMAPYPVGFFRALRDCAGLRRLLPEVDALFGVPQLDDSPEPVDVGEHQLRVLSVAARRGAPLAIRIAALLQKIGMGATPRLFWPSHVGHEQRGLGLLAELADRIALSAEAIDLAALAIAECDRVHRASDLRAGPIAALLARVQAETRPERFEQLLEVCICDYAAHPGHGEADYVKAPRMRRALAAYLSVVRAGQDGDAGALLEARAVAVDEALRGGGCAGGDGPLSGT
jgi:tRNA nucleotidyltransferase (CCA-adding enzyme)